MNTRRKYTKETLEPLVAQADSIAEVIRLLNAKVSGSTYNLISKRIKEYRLDTSHFTGQGWRKGRTFANERPSPEHYFVVLTPGSRKTDAKYLRQALIDSGVEYKCINGHEAEWMGKPLRLHVDHINGDNLDNRKENLRFLCPNCHDQTETWGRR